MAIAESLIIEIKAQVDKAISDMNRFNATTTKSKMGIKSLTSQLGKWLTGMVTATAAIMALRKAMKYAFDAAQYAAQFTQVEKAFKNIAKEAGQSADQVLSGIKKMSLGTVSDLKLMTAASRAALFDIPLDKLNELMHISMASATAMGQSVEYMFDSIVTGIGRGQPLIIDNLGLTLKVGQATEEYAKTLGKSADELTVNERKMAVLNATLEAGGALMEKVGDAALELTDAQRWEQMRASMTNMKKEIGVSLLPAFRELASAAKEFADDVGRAVKYKTLLKDIAENGTTLEKEIERINLQIGVLRDRMERLSGRGQDIVEEDIKALEKELTE